MSDEKKPMTLQETEQELSQTLFSLGRAEYERLLAEEHKERLFQKTKGLVAQSNDLRKKIAEEIRAQAKTPKLQAVEGGAGAPDDQAS